MNHYAHTITQLGLFFISVAVFFLAVVQSWFHPEYIPAQVECNTPGGAEVSQCGVACWEQLVQPGWIFGWPGVAFCQGAVQTCRELWLVQPSLELLVWQLCSWEVYHGIILKLFGFFAALLWELSVSGFVLWLVLPAPSWCCW